MKITHIIGLVVIAIAIGIVVASAGDAGQYTDFAEARVLAENGNDEKVHVVGELTKNEAGEIVGIEYEPLKDPNFIAFRMRDENGKEFRVISQSPPPSLQDFKKSEKVVIIGRFTGENFEASEILMKCPSKYEDKKLKTGQAAG